VRHSKEYKRLLKGLQRHRLPDADHPGPWREDLQNTARLFTRPAGVMFERGYIDGVPVEWIVPDAAARDGVLVYVHGGGYYMGSIDTYSHYVARLAKATGLRTIHFDYRLAPEHPFPMALNDAEAVMLHLLTEHAAEIPLVVAGDSAGGGLALATLIALRDAGHPLPTAAALLSPWTDLTCSGESFKKNQATDPVISTDRTRKVVTWYADGTALNHPLLSPHFADLSALPPLLILAGSEELLLDDSIRLAERARMQGVRVELEVSDGMVHVWPYYAEWIPEGQAALDRISGFFRAAIARE
jgi:acetyl esterase/lipase